MDNVDTQDTLTDNVDTQTNVDTQNTGVSSFSWKSNLGTDLANSPLVQKFDDDVSGLNQALESYGNLEKLLGHEKVPVPKDENDVEAWSKFSKAFGIPDKAEEYGLPDAQFPDAMKEAALGKERFAEIVHAHKLTPSQAKGLWESFTQSSVESYNKILQKQEAQMVETVNKLKGEWGDAYETNIELGQMVINKFSDDQEMNDFLIAALSQDPRGAKFLAKIGDQFAENKIGTFNIKRFSLGPEQASDEIQKILRDEKHPYNDPNAPDGEHQAAIDYVNSLYAVINRSKG